MYSTELIRKFPQEPEKPILFVVYNNTMIEDAEIYIAALRGFDYLDKHVKVVPFDHAVDDWRNYDIYIDPVVYKYRNSWND